MPTDPAQPAKVFYSYAHEDEQLREELKKHLANLKRQGVISEWHDRDISAGSEWNAEISKHLESADVILLLISPDFMNSDYINDVEVRRAMTRHEEGSACVIPVILRPTNWKGAPFSKLQALPSDARPITSWPNQDEAFLDVANGIEVVIGELNSDGSLARQLVVPSPIAPLTYIEPRSAVGFVPRKDREGNDIIELLRAELAPGSSRVSALWGAGGVGKTALAAEVARSLLDDYQQRIAWVSADGRDEFVLPSLLDEISNQLGQPELRTLGLEAKKNAVHDLVTASPTLVILDNFETVKPREQSPCLVWLTRLSPSSVLITTRARIDLPEVLNIPIKPLLPPEADEFLDRLLKQAQHRRTFEGIDREKLIKTAEANPLILQWVFGQINLAQDWRDVLKELAEGEGEAADRVFDRSFNLPLLNNGGRATLLALSLFVPSASRSALVEVAGLDGDKNKKKKFRDATKHLAALWLIRTTEDGTRLTVEGLTRDLAKTRLASDQRSVAIKQRFVTRFTTFASNNSGETISDLNALETERENVLAAIDHACGIKSWRSAIDIYLDIRHFLQIRGHWDDRLSRGEKVRTAALEINDKSELSEIAHAMANTWAARGEYAKAEQIYREVLEASSNSKSDRNIAITLYNLGQLFAIKGEIQQAKDLFDKSLQINKRLGSRKIARILVAQGTLKLQEGKYEAARLLYTESLEVNETLGDQCQIAVSLRSLGKLDEEEGKIDQSRERYFAGLEIDERMGNQIGIASSQRSLAALARQRGQLAEALKLCKESLEIAERLGDANGQGVSLHQLGLLARDQDKLVQARQLFDESLKIDRRLSNQLGIGIDLHELGTVDLTERAFDSAERLLNQSLSIFRDLNARRFFAECFESLGKLRTAQGSVSEARHLFREALEIAEELGQKARIASVLHSSALLSEKENNPAEAVTLFRQSLEVFESLGFAQAKKVKVDLQRLESPENSNPN